MSKKSPSKDEALEALDFIVNVLKEHEKDLDRLVNELAAVTEQLGDSGGLSNQVEKVESKLSKLQDEVSNLITFLSTSPREPAQLQRKKEIAFASTAGSPPVILRCRQWDDFVTLAHQAQTLSYLVKDAENSFQVDALKDNQVITYVGEMPKAISLLKTWLSRELDVPNSRILEGMLAIG